MGQHFLSSLLMLAVVLTLGLAVAGLVLLGQARWQWWGVGPLAVPPWRPPLADALLALWLVVVLYLVAALGTSLWLQAFPASEPGAEGSVYRVLVGGIVLQATFVVGLAVAAIGFPGLRPRWGSLAAGEAVGRGLLYFMIAQPIVLAAQLGMLAAYAAWSALGWPVAPEPQLAVEAWRAVASPLPWLLLFLLSVVGAPIVEEWLFRGVLYPWLKGKVGLRWAWVGSALVFALIHFNLTAFAGLFALGALFAWAYERTGDLRVPIVMHAAFNAWSVFRLLLPGDF